VEHTGYADFWELRRRGALPIETTNYVPIILAMTIMSKNASAYGLDQVVPDEAVEYDTIRTVSPTNLALIGDLADTSLPQLLQLNPGLLRSIAPGDFEIRVPKGSSQRVVAALDLVPAERRASWRMHRVAPGESLASIARQFNASLAQIKTANSLVAEADPTPGDQLLIPAAYREAAPAPPRVPHVAPRAKRPVTASTVAAKPPVHPTAGTLAAVKAPSRPLNR
jgi:membrane-bound lytic murein transglycosylase D